MIADEKPRLDLAADPPKPFRRDGMGYVYEPPTVQVRFRADYLSRRGDDVTAELVVESSVPGAPGGHLYQGRLNLGAVNSRRDLARDLDEMTAGAVAKETWRALLEQLCVSILRSERQGEPFEQVGRLPDRPEDKPRYQVERLLPYGKPTILYGPGGTGKGWLATGICVATAVGIPFAGLETQQGECLYLDFEDDKETLDERVKAISRGFGLAVAPIIHYRRCRAPLAHQVNQLSRFIHDAGITLAVVDSVGLGAGLAGEGRSYEEVALRFFDAIRQVGDPTWLLIDHVSEAGRQNTKTTGKAFGSVYKMNMSRAAWEVRKDQETGALKSSVGMYCTKTNHGPLQPPIGLLLDFQEEGVVKIKREDIRDSEELSKPLSLTDRVAGVLRHGAMSTKEIAEELGESEDSIRKTINRRTDRFGKLSDGRRTLLAEIGPRLAASEGEGVEEIPF